jgi:hypothetical protein
MRWRRILDVRAADLEEEMAEQRFSVPPSPTKTAATERTSQRAERAIKQSAMREQLSEEGPACITNTRHSTGLGRGHALGRGSQDSTVDP